MRMLLKALTRVPLPVLYAVGWCAYVIGFHVLRWRREQVADDLAKSFPERSAAERAAILRQLYRNSADMLMEAIWGFGAAPGRLLPRVTFENPEMVAKCVAEGRSVMLLAGHYCNWEWLALAGAARFRLPISAVYQPHRLEAVDSFLRDARARFGVKMIPRDDFIFELMGRGAEPRGYALVADQTPRRQDQACWVRFLNRDTAFYAGADRVARFLDASVLYAAMRRVRRGRYVVRLEVIAEPPYEFDEQDMIMKRFSRRLEQAVLEAPADWLWIQKRWKYGRPAQPRESSERATPEGDRGEAVGRR
jgi:KDO2-lipid IV(A) lauroyltransferase